MTRTVTMLALVTGVVLTAPVIAQPKETPAANEAKSTERIAELEGYLARQTTIAENARQEVEAVRAELKLKDELLVLGRERNAELYAIANEITQKYVRSRSIDPFIQSSRIKMENLKQSYEDRLHAARIYESTLPPSVQKRMDAELSAAAAKAAAESRDKPTKGTTPKN